MTLLFLEILLVHMTFRERKKILEVFLWCKMFWNRNLCTGPRFSNVIQTVRVPRRHFHWHS